MVNFGPPLDFGRISPKTVLWAADRIVQQHTADRSYGPCAQCTDRGCVLMEWAAFVIRNLRA